MQYNAENVIASYQREDFYYYIFIKKIKNKIKSSRSSLKSL